MTRELLGQLLGWLIVTVAAWFLALTLMAYSIGDIWPWNWTMVQRAIHLGLQLGIILGYAGALALHREERR